MDLPSSRTALARRWVDVADLKSSKSFWPSIRIEYPPSSLLPELSDIVRVNPGAALG